MPENSKSLVGLSANECRVLYEALYTFIHVHLGRADCVMDPVRLNGLRDTSLTVEQVHEVTEHLLAASEILTGVRNGGPGLYNPKVSEDARTARALIRWLEKP